MKNVPIPNYEQALQNIADQKIQKPEENKDDPSSEEVPLLQRIRNAGINNALSKIPIVSHMTRL